MTTVVNELINPPQDVSAALANLQNACSGWKPTQVTLPKDISKLAPPTEQAGPINWHPPVTEAVACKFIEDPSGFMVQNLSTAGFAIFLLLVMVVGIFWVFRLHRLPSAVFRLGRHIFSRAAV